MAETLMDELTKALKEQTDKREVIVEPVTGQEKPYLIVVRFDLKASDEAKKVAEREVDRLRKKTDIPVVLCPAGVNFKPVFEPAEMANWREEIRKLRCRVDDLERENSEGKARWTDFTDKLVEQTTELVSAAQK